MADRCAFVDISPRKALRFWYTKTLVTIQSGARNLTSCQLWEAVDRPIFEMSEFLGVLWKGWDLSFPERP